MCPVKDDVLSHISTKIIGLAPNDAAVAGAIVAQALIHSPAVVERTGSESGMQHDDERPRPQEQPDEAPDTPTDEPKPAPVQDPPSEPDPAPYVVRSSAAGQ